MNFIADVITVDIRVAGVRARIQRQVGAFISYFSHFQTQSPRSISVNGQGIGIAFLEHKSPSPFAEGSAETGHDQTVKIKGLRKIIQYIISRSGSWVHTDQRTAVERHSRSIGVSFRQHGRQGVARPHAHETAVSKWEYQCIVGHSVAALVVFEELDARHLVPCRNVNGKVLGVRIHLLEVDGITAQPIGTGPHPGDLQGRRGVA